VAARRSQSRESVGQPIPTIAARKVTISRSDNALIGATPSTEVPRYAGKGTFARIADIHEVSDYEIAVLGVPSDGGTSYRPRARFGPIGVRQAARTLRPGYHIELGATPLEEVQIVDAGDVTVTPFDVSEACAQIENRVREVIGVQLGSRAVYSGGESSGSDG
jgi:agmatinase